MSCSVHDVSNLERRGTPAVFVLSEHFASAATTQSEALGFDAATVFTRHPIQDRTDEEMIAIADTAFEALIAALSNPEPDTPG